MKLATLKDSTRDGKLVVVSRDLTRCSEVGHIARSLQAALDDWAHAGPRLKRVAEGLEKGAQPTMRFHEHDAASPLPRGYVWAAGSGAFAAPRDTVEIGSGTAQISATVQIAAIVDDVPAGTEGGNSTDAIVLLVIARDLYADGRVVGTSFSPVAVTPDELGEAWADGVASISLAISCSGSLQAPQPVVADFGQAVSSAAGIRGLSVGALVGDETAAVNQPLQSGDTLRIALKDKAGHSVFGAIEQTITVHGA